MLLLRNEYLHFTNGKKKYCKVLKDLLSNRIRDSNMPDIINIYSIYILTVIINYITNALKL